MLEIGLFLIVIAVLVLPITVHLVERNLEIFLFTMGLLAMSISHFFGPSPLWSFHIIEQALVEPIIITLAVLVVGLIVHFYSSQITHFIVKYEAKLGAKLFVFLIVVLLGIFSSLITAIMAAILLVEVVSVLKYNRDFEVKLIVLGCFSIGLGAALTPVGEPLSTIVVAKLRGAPYNADFFFLLKAIGIYVIPAIVAIGAFAFFLKPVKGHGLHDKDDGKEKINEVFYRSIKVYVFIMALIFLGTGFKPIVDMYIVKMSDMLIYWVNTISAIVDNATLTAAEISPQMKMHQIVSALMGLLIAGGMLIPGNIPNIIAAGRLKITSKEWAKFALPFGFVLMIIYFFVLFFI